MSIRARQRAQKNKPIANIGVPEYGKGGRYAAGRTGWYALVVPQYGENHSSHLPGHMADDTHIFHAFRGLFLIISTEHRVTLHRIGTGHPDVPSQVRRTSLGHMDAFEFCLA